MSKKTTDRKLRKIKKWSNLQDEARGDKTKDSDTQRQVGGDKNTVPGENSGSLSFEGGVLRLLKHPLKDTQPRSNTHFLDPELGHQ